MLKKLVLISLMSLITLTSYSAPAPLHKEVRNQSPWPINKVIRLDIYGHINSFPPIDGLFLPSGKCVIYQGNQEPIIGSWKVSDQDSDYIIVVWRQEYTGSILCQYVLHR